MQPARLDLQCATVQTSPGSAPAKPVQYAPEQFQALTGLRGFAALWVVSFHFMGATNLLVPASKHLNWFMSKGGSGVPLFFILSGFILIHTYRDKFTIFTWREYFNFIGLRIARIYPAYLVALAAMALLVWFAALAGMPYRAASYPLSVLPFEALMLHQWLPTKFEGWNFPDWSVSAEWFAYLFVFPVAIWLLRILSGVNHLTKIALTLALFGVEPIVRTGWCISMVSVLFLAGALMSDLHKRLPIPPHLDLAGALLLLGGLLFAPEFLNRYPSIFLMVLGTLILGLSNNAGIISRLLATRLTVFLGVISYSLYLSHGIVQRVLKVVLPTWQFSDASLHVRLGIWLVYLATILLAAIALYYGTERPARAWLRRRFEAIPRPIQQDGCASASICSKP